MRKLSYFLAVGILTATTVFVGCKKKSDPTPDAAPDAPVATSTMTTSNGGNSGTAIASIGVTASTGTAKIRLDVTSTVDLDKIYIMKSEDNGSLSAVSVGSITTSDNKTFTGGVATYSLAVPSSTKSFVIDIPVSIRSTSAAVSDVYYIWLTNGSGDFLKPTKNTVLGPATVTFNYTTAAVVSYATGSTTLGDQYASQGSLLVTGGQISALSTADYVDAPASADIALGDLNAGGTARTTGSGTGHLYFFSPSLRTSYGYTGCTACTPPVAEPTGNLTYIATYSGSFDSATGSDLAGLSVGTNTQVLVTANGVYMFQTSKGKRGLIKVTSTTAGTVGSGTATVSVKVLN